MRLPILFLLLVAACGKPHYTPQAGDLLFQVTPGTEFTRAITDVTSGRQGIPFSHVAMVVRPDDRTMVLEAIPGVGVRLLPLEAFLESSARYDGRPLVLAARLRNRHGIEAACDRAMKLLGRPYDQAFLPGSEAIYCSELVQLSFVDENGVPLFAAHPMNFRDSTGQVAPYWAEHYARLGIPVPEGVPGTNPGDLSQDPALEVIHTYFEYPAKEGHTDALCRIPSAEPE